MGCSESHLLFSDSKWARAAGMDRAEEAELESPALGAGAPLPVTSTSLGSHFNNGDIQPLK